MKKKTSPLQKKINRMVKKLTKKEKGLAQIGAGQARDILDKVALLLVDDKIFTRDLLGYATIKKDNK